MNLPQVIHLSYTMTDRTLRQQHLNHKKSSMEQKSRKHLPNILCLIYLKWVTNDASTK